MQKYPYVIVALIVFISDQVSKWSVMEHIIKPMLPGFQQDNPLGFLEWYAAVPERLAFVSTPVTSFFNIVMVWNQGVSFGMFSNNSDYGPIALSALSIVIAIIFAVWMLRSQSKLQCLAIGFVIAGALGNVIDRLRFGAVIDFLDFHAFGYHWPAFNVADSGICIGVFLLIIQSLFFETYEKNATPNINS